MGTCSGSISANFPQPFARLRLRVHHFWRKLGQIWPAVGQIWRHWAMRRPKLVKCGLEYGFDPPRQRMARDRPNLDQVRPDVEGTRPKLVGEIGENGQCRPNEARARPSVAWNSTSWNHLGQSWPEMGQNFDQTRPFGIRSTSAKVGPETTKIRPESADHHLAQIPRTPPNVDQCRPSLGRWTDNTPQREQGFQAFSLANSGHGSPTMMAPIFCPPKDAENK